MEIRTSFYLFKSDIDLHFLITYIYDFDAEVYGEELEVYLLERKRAEMQFSGVDALKAQMTSDIEAGRTYHRL